MLLRNSVLIIDNYDSFVHNLADEFHRVGMQTQVFRAQAPLATVLDAIRQQQVQALVFSPGPGTPQQATLCLALLQHAAADLPILGVCLGHQCIVTHFGGRVEIMPSVCHGKQAKITHQAQGLFRNLPSPLTVARYHSLGSVDAGDELIVDASLGEMVMAVRHRQRPIYGVQFHPESIMTPHGRDLVKAFLQQTTTGEST